MEWARFQIVLTSGSTKDDEAEAMAAARAALAPLSCGLPEQELRAAIHIAIEPTRKKLEQRKEQRRAEIQRQRQRQDTIESLLREVEPYLERLTRAGAVEIKSDFSSVYQLKKTVRAKLEAQPLDQTPTELRHLVHEIIDGEIEANRM